MQPFTVADAALAAQRIVEISGPALRLAAPVAIGKPNHILNALYTLVAADSRLSLDIYTGLTLMRPRPKSDLEWRFAGPIIERAFDAYPELAYGAALRDGTLPANIRVHEFFLQAGAWLDNAPMQQQFVSLGYAAAVHHLRRRRCNVFAQLVAPDPLGTDRLSLASNPDIILELSGDIASRRKAGEAIAIVAELNTNMPYMLGEAEVARESYDVLFDPPQPHFPLPGAPREPVSLASYAIALQVATLIKDGGTLQIGIGSFADALTHALILRHARNADFRAMLGHLQK